MEKKQKIIFRIEVEENDFGGINWTTTIIGQNKKPSHFFADKIYDDLGIEIEHCEYAILQEVIE